MTREVTADAVDCGPDVEQHVDVFAPYADAGYDAVYVATMGPNCEQVIRTHGEKGLPELRSGGHV